MGRGVIPFLALMSLIYGSLCLKKVPVDRFLCPFDKPFKSSSFFYIEKSDNTTETRAAIWQHLPYSYGIFGAFPTSFKAIRFYFSRYGIQ
jgi:hypothetical protein